MTETHLDEIEAAVGFPLPMEYRRVAAVPPFRPIGSDRVYWFYDDPSMVIEDTLAPLADGGYDQAGWQAGYLTIGNSGAGDLYVMDTNVAVLPVHCLCHETHAIEPEWSSFEEFVAQWVRAPDEIEARIKFDATEERWRMRFGLYILAFCFAVPLIAWCVLSLVW